MLYSIDIETTGLDPFTGEILCVGVYNPEFAQCFKPNDFKQWHSASNQYLAHNGAFDFNYLRRIGLDVTSSWVYDTKSMAALLVPAPLEEGSLRRTLGLEALSRHLLGLSDYKLDRTRMSSYSWDELSKYNLEDCRRTYLLFEYMVKQFNDADWDFFTKVQMPVTKLAAELEYNGVLINKTSLQQLYDSLSEERSKVLAELNTEAQAALKAYRALQISGLKLRYKEMLEKQLLKPTANKGRLEARYADRFELASTKVEPFNWGSPKQVRWLLKDFYKLDIVNERTDEESTDEATLRGLKHPVVTSLLKYRELDKLYNTCIPALLDNIKADGRVHGRYNVGGTRTGRLSSSGPNMQQLPGRLHEYIVASPGHLLVTADYAQIEPRLLAHASQEPSLLQAFREGHDIYSAFAKLIFNLDAPLEGFKQTYPTERGVGKTGGLSVIYGTGARKFAEMVRKDADYEIPYKQSRALVESFRKALPKVAELKLFLEREAMNQKKLYNLLGRPFYIESNDDLYMLSLNTYIQGSASDLVSYAFSKLMQDWSWAKPLMVVHDEVVFEIPEDKQKIVEAEFERRMTTALEIEWGLTVPLKIEYTIGTSWQKP